MNKPQTIALIALCLILVALLSVLTVQIASMARPTPQVVVVTPTHATPTFTPSATPTAPPPPTWTNTLPPTLPPTPTDTPTRTPTPTDTPTPLPPRRPTAIPTFTPTPVITEVVVISGTYPIPTPVPRYHIPEEAMTIVLLGSDQRPDWRHWNTDAIQYVVIYPDIPSVAVLSIPRDLYVYLPNFKMSRINTADMYGEIYQQDGGGIGYLNQTLLYNLGITADYYVKVNFDGLIGLVDAMGGIDVPVHCRLEDYWPYPDENGVYHILTLEPGVHHLDGERALWYSRSRKTTSVFSRERRQQQVIEAMWHTAKRANMFQIIPELYEQYGHLFQTDLDWGNILKLGQIASQVDAGHVRRYNIGAREVDYYVTQQGGNVFIPQWEAIAPIIDDVMTPPASSRAARAEIRVEVWNGGPHDGWGWLAADRLFNNGYTAEVGTADRRDYPQSRIYVFSSNPKGTGVEHVQALFNVPDELVTYVGDVESPYKLRLVIGQNYAPCH
jgi:LCP family protein required for cell wall assembly